MQIIKFECRVEKKLTDQKVVKIYDNLPPYVECLECMSCGVLGIAMIDKEKAIESNL